jgi:hypothetical protein
MKSDGDSVERVGVLRLRGRFAARSSHSAQDDSFRDLYEPSQSNVTP